MDLIGQKKGLFSGQEVIMMCRGQKYGHFSGRERIMLFLSIPNSLKSSDLILS